MNSKKRENRCPYATEWTVEIAKELVDKVLTPYFEGDFSLKDLLRFLKSDDFHQPKSKITPKYTLSKPYLPLLNNAELGRFCHFCQKTPSQFNRFFGTNIRNSDIPSSYNNFRKQSDNKEKTNLYKILDDILFESNQPFVVKGETPTNFKRETERRLGIMNTEIQDMEEELEKLKQKAADYAANCSEAYEGLLRQESDGLNSASEPPEADPFEENLQTKNFLSRMQALQSHSDTAPKPNHTTQSPE